MTALNNKKINCTKKLTTFIFKGSQALYSNNRSGCLAGLAESKMKPKFVK